MDVDNTEVPQGLIPIAEYNETRENQTCTMFIDGLSIRDGSDVVIVLKSPGGTVIEQDVRLGFTASNNKLEYEAFIVGLKKAKILRVKILVVHYDSQLMANQLARKYAAKN